MLTDAEQDLLRAALVFAGAGLDAVLKQLIRGALPMLAKHHASVQIGFENFVARRIRDDRLGDGSSSSGKFLASIVAAVSPRDTLTEAYIQELTGDSLQSHEEVMRASKALGLDSQQFGNDVGELRRIFAVRNKIIHELDIDLDGSTRKRVSRNRDPMVADGEMLLRLSAKFVELVELKLGDDI